MGVTILRSPSLIVLLCICCSLELSIHAPCASSISFNLNFSEPKPFCGPMIICSGEASVSLGMLDLTKKGGVGRATYAQPVPLWNAAGGTKLPASFTTSFTFRITPDPRQPNTGDGMAFFLAPYPAASLIPPNSGGGNLGLLPAAGTSWTGDGRFVAIEFDTWRNGPPADINGNHVAIDVNSIVSVASTNTSSPTRNLTSNFDMAATINYNGSNLLTVDLQINGSSYHVNTTLDLSSILPEEVAVGFSGATGSSSEMHRVLTWSFSSTLASSNTSAIRSKLPKKFRVLLSVLVPSLFLLLCGAGASLLSRRRWRRRRRRLRPRSAQDEASDSGGDSDDEQYDRAGELERGVASGGPRRYTYRELAAATCDFAEENKLGRGGFGSVFRGQVKVGDQERAVAIKMFSSESSAQGRKEFEAEVRIISRVKHRNLVQLLGWCDSRRNGLMLVYELVAQGSLDRHLYSRDRFLTWPERYQIILGLGSALRHLHEEWEQCIVHGDIKPSNIMLDESLGTKLGDFGLARLVDHGAGWQTTQAVLGTAGYIDPEFVNTRRPSTQSDVYSFGIVLLEIVCNRPPLVLQEAGQQFALLKRVWSLYGRNAIVDATDERLRGGDDEKGMEHVLVTGLWCAHPDPSERPSIGEVMHVLQSEDKGLPALPPQMYKAMSSVSIPGRPYGALSIDAYSAASSSATTSNTNQSSDSSSSALLRN